MCIRGILRIKDLGLCEMIRQEIINVLQWSKYRCKIIYFFYISGNPSHFESKWWGVIVCRIYIPVSMLGLHYRLFSGCGKDAETLKFLHRHHKTTLLGTVNML